MSVFSRIRLSKQAAKDHKESQANKENEQPVKVAYKHVPKHAAFDSLSGCPSAWTEENRPKIMAANKRRTQIAEQTTGSSSRASISSGRSSVRSIGGVSIATSNNARLVHANLPKNRSLNAYHQTWKNPVTMDVERPSVPRVQSSQSFAFGTYNGPSYGSTQRMRRGHSYQDSAIGRSPLSSHMNSADHSRVNSSGNSTISSSSDLEIAMPVSKTRAQQYTIPSSSALPRTSSDPKISSSLRTSMTVDAPTPAVVKRGPMPVAKVQAKEEKPKKQRLSMFSRKKSVAA